MKDLQNFEYKINGTLFQHHMFRIDNNVYSVCAISDVNVDSDPILLTVTDKEDVAVIQDICVEQAELMTHVLETNIKCLAKPFVINLSPITDDYRQIRWFLEELGFEFSEDDGISRGIRKVVK